MPYGILNFDEEMMCIVTGYGAHNGTKADHRNRSYMVADETRVASCAPLCSKTCSRRRHFSSEARTIFRIIT